MCAVFIYVEKNRKDFLTLMPEEEELGAPMNEKY